MENKETLFLRDTLSGADQALLGLIAPVVDEAAPEIAGTFYDHMLYHPESAPFLNHEIVQKQLKTAMTDWIRTLFKPGRAPKEIQAFITRQVDIGNRHARINIPMTAITIGTSVLKRELFRHIVSSKIDRNTLAEAIILTNEVIDHAMAVINFVYMGEIVQDARDRQSLKLHSIGVDMALQTESLRASLFDWHRQILRILIDQTVRPDKIPSIRKTDFGLWVYHKGDLMFPGLEEIVKLKEAVSFIDASVSKALARRGQGWSTALEGLLNEIDDRVTSATAILGVITDRTMAMEGGRDSLTKLFNRRFLRGILQKEVETSIRTGERFAVIIVDIDHFKSINDTHGHDAGDAVLKQMAEILIGSVRAGDYVFRYGGEEFLIVINSVNSRHAGNVAEKVHRAVCRHQYLIPDEQTIQLTASLGLSVHDGHPDYSRLISRADEALYQAKESGRNRWVLLTSDSG